MSYQKESSSEKMEADSTTPDYNSKDFPFPLNPGNFQLYKTFVPTLYCTNQEKHIVEKLRTFGLLSTTVPCKTRNPTCRMVCHNDSCSRDGVVWICEGCNNRQSIRCTSFFNTINASLLQVLQILLAWSEDVHPDMAAKYFGTTRQISRTIFSKLDQMAVLEQKRLRLGGPNSVVMADIYPDCVDRVTPDTTQKKHGHQHRILMMADTNHVPTRYILHVIKDKDDRQPASTTNPVDPESLKQQILEVARRVVLPHSSLVTGPSLPAIAGASTFEQLERRSTAEMQKFLTVGIWRRALKLCEASRDICTKAQYPSCVATVQDYLDIASYRAPRDHLFASALQMIADRQRALDHYNATH